MISLRLLGPLVVAACVSATTVLAAEQPLPPALKGLQQQGVKVVKQFDAPDGLRGFIVTADGQAHAVYVTADGQHLLLGVLIDADGHNLTEDHLDKYAPKPDFTQAWQALQNARWVAEGAKDPKRVVYVMADPHCPYCHAFWLASQPYEKVGLQVRWIWVSYLRPDGMAKAAAILDAKDPVAAMERHERQFRQGGIEAAQNPKPETLAAVRANTELMQTLNVNGTPAVFFKDGDGKVQMIQGMPKLRVLPQVFGLPEQKIDDPALARFR